MSREQAEADFRQEQADREELAAENDRLLAQCERLSAEVERLRAMGLALLEEWKESEINLLCCGDNGDTVMEATKEIEPFYQPRKAEWEK